MTRPRSLLSFVPDKVRHQALARIAPAEGVETSEAIVLFADVSGFTPLAMSLRDLPGGVDDLSRILNDGFAHLINAITRAQGDVVGFAGDAITAIWPVSAENASAAAWAALEAQRGMRDADHRVNLRIGLGSGAVSQWTLGNPGSERQVLATGEAIVETSSVQEAAPIGGVAASETFLHIAGESVASRLDEGVTILTGSAQPTVTLRPTETSELDVEQFEYLREYLPHSVVARLSAGHDQFLAEVRVVTAVMVGLSVADMPHDLPSFQHLVGGIQEVVSRYGAILTVSFEGTGLSLLLVFGVPPFVHEHNADRALMAVQQILGANFAGDVGIGVASGPAFCGAVGTAGRREFATLGDVVNTAARLANHVRSTRGVEALCDSSAMAEARGQWEFASSISVRIKGASELLIAAPPLSRVPSTVHETTGIVDRPEENEIIDLLIGAERDGPRAVVVEGEAGIGKSSLVERVCVRLADEDVRIATGTGDVLERAEPLHAWRHVIKDLLEIDPTDEQRTLETLATVGEHAADLIGPLFGIAAPNSQTDMAPVERIAATHAVISDVLTQAAERHGRVTIVLEDAHWFDSASLTVLSKTVGVTGVSFVVTTRPVAGEAANVMSQIVAAGGEKYQLEPFGATEIETLVRLHLDVDELEPQLIDLLLERCHGHPYFTSEVLDSLRQQNALVVSGRQAKLINRSAATLPESIQAAIGSRIDQLSQDEQLSLKVASVIGSPFELDVIVNVHPTQRAGDDVRDDLSGLSAAGLVTAAGDKRYAFRHALTREVAYGLMMGEQRRELHRAVAEYHEAATAERDSVYPLLAHHWLRAEQNDKAVGYLSLASVAGVAHGMPREATNHGVDAARLLGIELETDPLKITELLPAELGEIERLMAGRRPTELASLPELVDETTATAIGVILQTMPSAHQSLQMELFALMAVRNLNLTLRFGAGVLAPGVYSMYSIVLRGLGLDSVTAAEFSELARQTDAANGHVLASSVAFVHVFFNRHWFSPIESGVEIAHSGADAGLAGPDLLYGSFNLAAAAITFAASGASLDDVIEMSERHADRIGMQSETALFHCRLEAQTARALAGRTASPTSLSDDWCNEGVLAAMTETQNFQQTAYYFIAKLRLAYLSGQHADAIAWAEQAHSLLPSFVGQIAQIDLAVLSSLARLADAEDEARRSDAIEFSTERLAELVAWEQGWAPNFTHKVALVSAEIAAARGDLAAATMDYSTAVAQADSAGFQQWAALATERWALATGDADLLTEAVRRYRVWGADAKASLLEASHAASDLSGSADALQ